ncbi:lipopolysaccharide biosynthesis protein [Rhodophyticola sp. CCM32]|uniref:lipopolysaccharide biosynthesis protein n=1 Tax=Rhodophyticola sp. CCM32 TaxID=2916397 RepID=UPI00107F6A95|nr:lipopolysaccharide biosynthesis protein [Rhodophyticola sp. CCM32]QBY01801.1 lipopolysaccharide biosynthesis protein [Rhodophyticola sp. CCM32]
MTGLEGTAPGGEDPPNRKDRNLTRKTLGNFLWMFGGGGVEAVLKIVVLIVLARLLLPAEFGLVSAALTVVALAEVTGRIGVAPSIVQIKTLTRDHVATGMVATLVMGLLMAGIVYFLAGPIAVLYRMPELKPFVEVFALLFLIKGAGLVSDALLQRNMRFRELALIRLASYLFGYAAVAIVLAVLDFGAWALVLGQLAQAGLQTLLYFLFARDGLAFGFRWATFTTMFRFGFGVTLTQIGNYISQNADYFVVGRWLGADALGYYSRAYLLLKQPAQLVGRMGDQVLFPALATIQDDRPRMERALNRALSLVAMTQVPLSVLLVVTAPEIILTLMGPQWGPAVLPFQILVGVLFFRTAYKFVGAILRAAGKVYVAALWQWSHAAAVLAGAIFGQAFGLWGVSLGVSGAVIFCHLFGLFLVHRVIGVGSRDCMIRLVVYAGLGAVFALALIPAKAALMTLGGEGIWLLVILCGGFGLAYLGLFAAMPKLFGPEGEILREQLTRVLRRKRGKQS